AEWAYAAAGGSAQRVYPWGGSIADSSHAVFGCFYQANGNCTGVFNIAPVGSLPKGNGLWGQSDLAGNVFEWTLDWYAQNYTPTCNDCANLIEQGLTLILPRARIVRGGAFDSNLGLKTSERGPLGAYGLVRSYVGGFRCARDP